MKPLLTYLNETIFDKKAITSNISALGVIIDHILKCNKDVGASEFNDLVNNIMRDIDYNPVQMKTFNIREFSKNKLYVNVSENEISLIGYGLLQGGSSSRPDIIDIKKSSFYNKIEVQGIKSTDEDYNLTVNNWEGRKQTENELKFDVYGLERSDIKRFNKEIVNNKNFLISLSTSTIY